MKEVTIDGIIYVPEGKEKILATNHSHISNMLNEKNLKKWQAYFNILKICAYLNNEFKSDKRQWTISETLELFPCQSKTLSNVYHFTSKEAAEYALNHFKEIFKIFYN